MLRANLDALGLAGQASVVPMDVGRYLAGQAPEVDLALADPPYAFDGWDDLMAGLRAPLLVAESDRPIEPGPGWEAIRAKRYGTTHVTFVRRS